MRDYKIVLNFAEIDFSQSTIFAQDRRDRALWPLGAYEIEMGRPHR